MSDLPELRFLDEAARAIGQTNWDLVCTLYGEGTLLRRSIVIHARTLQKLAELEAENARRSLERDEAREQFDNHVKWASGQAQILEWRIEVTSTVLEGVRAWLRDERLNTYRYMEGAQFYEDKSTAIDDINEALAQLARPLPSPPKGPDA